MASNTGNASIIIYDMQGAQIKSISVNNNGEGSVIINASELKTGMYMYSLIGNGKLVDTKTMIITN